MKRKREIVKLKPRRPPNLAANETFLNADNDSGLDDFGNAEFGSVMDDVTPQAGTNMSSWQAGLQKQVVVNGRTEYSVNTMCEMNIAAVGNVSNEGGSITAKSSRGFGPSSINPISNAALLQGERTHQEELRLHHQDSQYKEQELNSALFVIKKTMKMDAAEPFNIPVNVIRLGIPDYFDIIDTPMDFGTICNNLVNGVKYMNSKDVFKDVQYIWENCCKYNKEGDYILELMDRVKTNFMKLWTASGLYVEQPQGINGYSYLMPPTESTQRRSERGKECPVGLVTTVTDNPGHHHLDQTGSSQVPSHQPSSIHIQAHQPQQSANQAQPSLLQANANIGSTDSTTIRRRTRGPTRCHYMLNREERRISIVTNELGQPIGLQAPKLTSFLGMIARDGLMAPLIYVGWKAMPDANKENMWQQVQLKFDIDPKAKSWVLLSLGYKWSAWKCNLKATRYNTHATDEERLADRDERVLPDQWSTLISYWSSEEAKKRSAINKANRALQKFTHTTGSKSFARVREEQRAKKPGGKEPSRAELFILTRTRKDGKPVNEAASAVISQLRATQQQETSRNSGTLQDDILSQVVGRDRHGRLRFSELGPSPSDLRGPNPTRTEAMRMVSEANAEVREMKERMVAMEQTCAQMASQMATMISLVSSMEKHPSNVVADATGVSEDLTQQQVHASSSHREVSPRETRAMKRAKMQIASTSKVNHRIN